MSESRLVGIPADKIEVSWRFVEPFIARACKRTWGRYEAEDIKPLLLNRDAQLWVSLRDGVIEAAAVTEITVYPHLKVCRLFLCSGKRREHWLVFEPTVEAWAKSQGCEGFEIIGRRGWARVLRHWQMANIILYKEFR